MRNEDKNYFELKGKSAEQSVHELASKTFLKNWSFPNPKLPNGKELCDLLIVFDDTAIIWQIKDIKLNEQGMYNKKEFNKNLRQLGGAKRRLFDLKTPIALENVFRKIECVDISSIKQVFLIAAFAGESQIGVAPMEETKDKFITVFTGDSIEIVLNELDTISDFIEYLKDREAFFKNTAHIKKCIVGGEQELLAYYLANNRDFNRHIKDNKCGTMILNDCWDGWVSSPEYKAKEQANELSYLWDSIIDDSKRTGEDIESDERITRAMARLNRFQRRCISKIFIEARINAHNNKHPRRIVSYDGITYCFLFQDSLLGSKDRQKLLEVICWIGGNKFQQNKKILGIATEPKIQKQSLYDFCFIENLEWTEENQKIANDLQKELGFFENPITSNSHEYEYPKWFPTQE